MKLKLDDITRDEMILIEVVRDSGESVHEIIRALSRYYNQVVWDLSKAVQADEKVAVKYNRVFNIFRDALGLDRMIGLIVDKNRDLGYEPVLMVRRKTKDLAGEVTANKYLLFGYDNEITVRPTKDVSIHPDKNVGVFEVVVNNNDKKSDYKVLCFAYKAFIVFGVKEIVG